MRDIIAVCRDLPPVGGAVVRALADHPGQRLTSRQIADIVYLNAPGAGPDNYRVTIHLAIARIAGRLARHGWRISTRLGNGAGYQLEALK